jgi:sulfonate transport system substrate-binding protein
MVSASTYTGQGDQLLVPKGSPIRSVKDLEGKKVAVAEGSSAKYHLLAQLEKAGLEYGDVQVQNLQPPDALAAFSSGHVDAWAIWDPYASQAVVDADAVQLADGEGLVNGFNFEVAAQDALDDKATETALKDYLNRITKAQIWSSEHRADWSKVWAEQTGLAPEITAMAAKNRPVTPVEVDQSVIDSEQQMADTFAKNGLLPGKVDVSAFFDDRFNEYTTGKAVR